MRRIHHLRKRTGSNKRVHFLYKLLWISLGILLLLAVIIPGMAYVFPRVFRNSRVQNSGNNHSAISLLPSNTTTLALQHRATKWQNSSYSPTTFTSTVTEKPSYPSRRVKSVGNGKNQLNNNVEMRQLLLSIKPQKKLEKIPDTELHKDQSGNNDFDSGSQTEVNTVSADHDVDELSMLMFAKQNSQNPLLKDDVNYALSVQSYKKISTQKDYFVYFLEETLSEELRVTHLIFNHRLISLIPLDDDPLAIEFIGAFVTKNFQDFSRIVRLGVKYPLVLEGDKITPFLKFVVIENLLDYLRVILKYYPADTYPKIENPHDLLTTAIIEDKLDAIILLTDKFTEYGQDYMHHATNLASRNGQFEIVRYFIDTRLYSFGNIFDRLTLLFEVLHSNNKMLIEYLDSLDNSVVNYIFPKNHENVLHFIIGTLLSNGEKTTLTTYGEKTLQGALKYFPHLMRGKDDQGNTPLHKAVLLGSDQVASILLAAGADMLEKNNNHQTPYMLIKWNNHAMSKAFSEAYHALRRWDYFHFLIKYRNVELISVFYWIVGAFTLVSASGTTLYWRYKVTEQQLQQMLAELTLLTRELLDTSWQHESGRRYSIKLSLKSPGKILKYLINHIECNQSQLTVTPAIFFSKLLLLLQAIYGQDKVAIIADRLVVKNVSSRNISDHTLQSGITRFCEEIVASSSEYLAEIERVQSITQRFINNPWTASKATELFVPVDMKSPEELARALPGHSYKSLTLRPAKARDIIVTLLQKHFSDKVVTVSNEMPDRITLQIMRVSTKKSAEIVKEISQAIIENSNEYLSERFEANILQLQEQYRSIQLLIDKMKQEIKISLGQIAIISELRKRKVEKYRQECHAQFRQPQHYIIEQEEKLIAIENDFKARLGFAAQYAHDKDYFEIQLIIAQISKSSEDATVLADDLNSFSKKITQLLKEIAIKNQEFQDSNNNFDTKLAKEIKKFTSEESGKRDKGKVVADREKWQRNVKLLPADSSTDVPANKTLNAAVAAPGVEKTPPVVMVPPEAVVVTPNNTLMFEVMPERPTETLPIAAPAIIIKNKVSTSDDASASVTAVSSNAGMPIVPSATSSSPNPSGLIRSEMSLGIPVSLSGHAGALFYPKRSSEEQQKSPRLLAEDFKNKDDLYAYLKKQAASIEYFTIKEDACLYYINMSISCIRLFFKGITDEYSFMAQQQLYETLVELIKIIEEYVSISRVIFRHSWTCLNNAEVLERNFMNSSAIFSASKRQESAARIYQLCRLLTSLQPCVFEESRVIDMQSAQKGSLLMRHFSASP